jgi:hypothetical protein
MSRTVLLLSAAIFVASSVAANSQALTPYSAQTCAKWSELHNGAPTTDTSGSENWVMGYVEGVGRYVDAEYQMKGQPTQTLKGLNRSAVIVLVNQFCKSSPNRTLQSMVSELTGQMTADATLHVTKAAETTGSAEITGSIAPTGVASKCHMVAVRDVTAGNSTLAREFRNCN